MKSIFRISIGVLSGVLASFFLTWGAVIIGALGWGVAWYATENDEWDGLR